MLKINGDIPLDIFHEVLQIVMGWYDCHLHQFFVGKTYYSIPTEDSEDFGMKSLDERDFTLKDVAPKKGSLLRYEYDFGDSWIHLIKVMEVINTEPDFLGALCLGGENACPPEDSGGVWGYHSLLEVLQDPEHEEYEETRAWIGPKFDPTAFHLKKVNTALKRITAS